MFRTHRLALFLAFIIANFASGVAVANEPHAASTTDSCCYTNPRYSGVCQVSPLGDETCSSILGYLNNQMSVGKAYCGGTKVRGGWAQVSCENNVSSRSNNLATNQCWEEAQVVTKENSGAR
ncbi:MAG: hypothetical protein GY906_38050 [bacterium]|nr:hypothetical protein [bacterium]